MQNAEWIALFRRMPVELHPQVVLVLNNRTEISMETLFRVEPSCLVLRGRVSGTNEGGMLFVVPYVQLSAMYLNRQIMESEVEQIFSKARQEATPEPTAAATPAGPPEEPAAPPNADAAAPAGMPAFGRPSEATAVARNNLLERLRAARQAAQSPAAK